MDRKKKLVRILRRRMGSLAWTDVSDADLLIKTEGTFTRAVAELEAAFTHLIQTVKKELKLTTRFIIRLFTKR